MSDETCKNLRVRVGKAERRKMRDSKIFAVTAFGLLLQFSGIFWAVNYFYAMAKDSEGDNSSAVAPHRWLFAVSMPVVLASWGFYRKSLSLSGAVTALFVGFFVGLSSYCFAASLITFFVTSSKVTKVGARRKRALEADFKEGGQRDWCQVVSNGAMAAELAILYMIDVGVGERPVDFVEDYRPSYLGMAVLGAISCVNGDTWASELGTVVSTTSCRLVTTGRVVPKGTNGGVTLGGLVFSALGGLVVGLAYYVVLLLALPAPVVAAAPPQWPVVFVGAVGGLVGSLVDSVLGATLQFSGLDRETGKVLEKPGPKVDKISGVEFLDNCSVNLVSSVLAAFAVAEIAKFCWP